MKLYRVELKGIEDAGGRTVYVRGPSHGFAANDAVAWAAREDVAFDAVTVREVDEPFLDVTCTARVGS